jgi:pyochelin biosynthetic protein PchC
MAADKAEGSPWVRRLRPSPSRAVAGRRLVCFPHAGGAASYFVPLARTLSGSPDAAGAGRGGDVQPGAGAGPDDAGAGAGAGIEVLGLQYPGRQDRLSEPALDSIPALVEAIVPELWGWLDRPLALLGHSMGAIVAFEVALALEQQGVEPLALFASGRRAPSTWRDEHVHRGGDDRILAEVTRLAGTPSQLFADEDVRQMVLPALRADYKAIETYVWRPGRQLGCPVWALVGETDPLTTVHEAAAWSAHTTAPFALRTFPGSHFYFASDPSPLATFLTDKLAVDEDTP